MDTIHLFVSDILLDSAIYPGDQQGKKKFYDIDTYTRWAKARLEDLLSYHLENLFRRDMTIIEYYEQIDKLTVNPYFLGEISTYMQELFPFTARLKNKRQIVGKYIELLEVFYDTKYREGTFLSKSPARNPAAELDEKESKSEDQSPARKSSLSPSPKVDLAPDPSPSPRASSSRQSAQSPHSSPLVANSTPAKSVQSASSHKSSAGTPALSERSHATGKSAAASRKGRTPPLALSPQASDTLHISADEKEPSVKSTPASRKSRAKTAVTLAPEELALKEKCRALGIRARKGDDLAVLVAEYEARTIPLVKLNKVGMRKYLRALNPTVVIGTKTHEEIQDKVKEELGKVTSSINVDQNQD